MAAGNEVYKALKDYFGFDSFRSHQEAIINSVLSGNDNLVIMPTGGGKSICYQLPAILLPGLTLVISPLIALMKDQVDGLHANGISAAFLNSTQSASEQDELFKKIRDKKIKLLYVAPESLGNIDPLLSMTELSLIAVDEAHCISSWGHDFRPSYTQLGYLKNRYPGTPVIGLTATADKATREDIVQQLNIPNAQRYISSFNRQNLSLEVRPANERFKQILTFIDDHPDECGIIYCLSRKSTENLAAKLNDAGLSAACYHAGLDPLQRAKVQDNFVNDKIKIICATIAFGMGIDKSNVRWVIHYNLPKNIESYYQEIGRAGRDGLPSDTLLFHSYGDVLQLRKFAENTGNSEVQLAKIDRVKQYTDALTCRRKILLGYFGEYMEENCGNCDICTNPPKFTDGTIIAQKALSCVARIAQKEPIGTIIDILRGSHNQAVMEGGYDNIKTYGVGKDISWSDWQHYLIELINIGYLEIAFHEKNHIKLTDRSNQVLFNGEKVALSLPQEKSKQSVPAKAAKSSVSKSGGLFEKLKALRLQISQEEDIPAYLVFSDATLREIEQVRPQTDEEFMQINGVGKRKLDAYGYAFIKEVISFQKEKKAGKPKKKDATYQKTFDLYKQGMTVEEIAKERQLNSTTIFSHLAKLYSDGKDVDLFRFVDKRDLDSVREARETLKEPDKLKPYYDHFNGSMDYWTIRLCLTLLETTATP
ncbi:DNA helicase RecQ [Robertkochia solimangrovi]|uniref:DNA helicase RecQ n=1 Tax=Robertkochia solimangrovi TaxID=2213046 RepID=UPI00118118B0|nr:DNA helicase RecQ [Robertkochia solimangrovi]TRZ42595.1 DNA helicase RecQ [Robertkochia solimangrovi]